MTADQSHRTAGSFPPSPASIPLDGHDVRPAGGLAQAEAMSASLFHTDLVANGGRGPGSQGQLASLEDTLIGGQK